MKTLIRLFTISIATFLMQFSPDLLARDSVQDTPGNFYAVTLPDGQIRARLTIEEYKEKNNILSEEVPPVPLKVDFSEQVYSLELSLGLPNNWEVGVLLPYTDAAVDVIDSAGTNVFSASDGDLGNIRFITKYGHQFPEKSLDLLAELEVGFPTDKKTEDLQAAGDARLSLTLERYWDKLSASAKVAANYRAEEEFSGGDTTEEIQLGIGYELSPKIYTSALAIHDDDLNFVEVTGEYKINDKISLEAFATKDVDSDENIKFYGITLNYLFN